MIILPVGRDKNIWLQIYLNFRLIWQHTNPSLIQTGCPIYCMPEWVVPFPFWIQQGRPSVFSQKSHSKNSLLWMDHVPSLSQSPWPCEYNALISLGFSHSPGAVERNQLVGKQVALELGKGLFLQRNQYNVITDPEMMLATIAASILCLESATQKTGFS